MDGVQGDQDFLHKIFQFKRHLDLFYVCMLSVFASFDSYVVRCLVVESNNTWNKDHGIPSVDLRVSIVALLLFWNRESQKGCFTLLLVIRRAIALRNLALEN